MGSGRVNRVIITQSFKTWAGGSVKTFKICITKYDYCYYLLFSYLVYCITLLNIIEVREQNYQ